MINYTQLCKSSFIKYFQPLFGISCQNRPKLLSKFYNLPILWIVKNEALSILINTQNSDSSKGHCFEGCNGFCYSEHDIIYTFA